MESPSDPPSSQGRKVSEQDAREGDDQAFAKQNRIEAPGADYSATITDEDISHAGKFPLSGRSGKKTLFPTRTPEEFPEGPILQRGNMRNLPEDHGRCTGENLDPLAQVLHAAGALPAEQDTFRILGANFQMERLFVGSAFRVWTFPGQHEWRLGNTSGAWGPAWARIQMERGRGKIRP